MSEIKIGKCIIQTDLHYLVEDHSWARFNDDGTVTVGITDVAENMAGPILHVYPRKKGMRQKGQSLATIESGKWVGPLKSPITGEILEANVRDYATRMAANAPLTMAAAKATIREGLKDGAERDLKRIATMVSQCFDSEDYREGVKAFLEKRRPNFQGR